MKFTLFNALKQVPTVSSAAKTTPLFKVLTVVLLKALERLLQGSCQWIQVTLVQSIEDGETLKILSESIYLMQMGHWATAMIAWVASALAQRVIKSSASGHLAADRATG